MKGKITEVRGDEGRTEGEWKGEYKRKMRLEIGGGGDGGRI